MSSQKSMPKSSEIKSLLQRKEIEFNATQKMVETNSTLFQEMKKHEENAKEAQAIVQTVASSIQEQAHSKIASVVSRCLDSVFDEPYEFQIQFERKRGKTEARLVFVRDEHEYSPIDSSGGGVIDVAAFALRVACLMLSVPAKRRTIVLDEPFKFVSIEYRDSIREMIELLSEEMSVQFIIVTHIPEIKCGKVIEVK